MTVIQKTIRVPEDHRITLDIPGDIPVGGIADLVVTITVPLEVTRHTLLTDKQVLHYFELPKLPDVVNADDGLKLWLALFNAETEEDLARIEALEVTVMQEAIGAYRRVVSTGELREIERLRALAKHNEASALHHARRVAMAEGMAKGKAEGKAEGMAEGVTKGMTKGRVEGQIESIRTLLEIRFGAVPEGFHERLRGVEGEERMASVLKCAATCGSLAEFQETLKGTLSTAASRVLK